PVHARMVEHPADYPWSSYRYHAYGEANPYITPHELYERLDRNEYVRRESYRSLFMTDLDKEALHAIRRAVEFSMPLGNDRFRAEIEEALGRKIGYAKRGKPKQVQKEESKNMGIILT